MATEVDVDFLREGAKHSSGSLKQGVGGHSHPEAMDCLVLNYQNLKFRTHLMNFMYVCM